MKNSLRSILGRRQGARHLDADELDEMARRAWHENGVVCVNPARVQVPAIRATAEALGQAVYGKRREDR